jgi:phosphatidylglycerol---prolipoprotein diacylglyceryl transferase
VSEILDLRYVVPATLGLVLLVAYPVSLHLDPALKPRYYLLQGITLLGALVGAKIVVLVGDRGWPAVPVQGLADVVGAGRSVVGGLLFGFLTAEAVKPLLRYRLPPNDRFAAILPFSLALGRVGCYLSGCCRGTSWDGGLSVTYADGIPRHPAQLYEAGFQVAAGVLLMMLEKRGILKGRLFALYLVAYGAYRFLSEFIRETPHVFLGYSAYQGFCVLMIAAGAVTLVLRRKGVHGTATIVPAASAA